MKLISSGISFGTLVITLFLCHMQSAKAEIYKSKEACISANAMPKSNEQMVKELCSSLTFKTQEEIQFDKDKEKLQQNALPLGEFLEQEKRRSEERARIRKIQEKNEQKERVKEAELKTLEEKQRFCEQVRAQVEVFFSEEKKRGVPRYWSEHYARNNAEYVECQRFW